MSTRRSAIVARDVGVEYDVRLTHDRTLRRSAAEFLRERRSRRAVHWALKGVGLTVAEGEVLGVIGSNGAGKSTLLLTIAGVLRPSRGEISTFGRKATLLTLGAAFEPDLTGRQNMELTAAYLGLSRNSVRDRSDEVIEFSELGQFIDAPLRTYSTGMRTRLAFSIAAHIDPEILLLDELLAVGDAAFQQKSQAKLLELMESASAIMVVTHALDWVRATCTRALWLEQGTVVDVGEPASIVQRYLAHAEGQPRAASMLRPEGDADSEPSMSTYFAP